MAVEIKNIKRPWTAKQSMTVAIISLIIGLVIFIVSYITAVYGGLFGSLNQQFLDFMITSRQSNLTDYMKITTVGGSLTTISTLTVAITIIWVSYYREFWRPILLVFSMLLAAASTTIFKSIIMTNRPPTSSMVAPFETYFAFPSGHTIGIFVLALIIGYLICSRRSSIGRIIYWTLAVISTTSLMAFSRLYLGYHWLTDIFGAFGLGFIILAIIIFIDKAITNRFEKLQ